MSFGGVKVMTIVRVTVVKWLDHNFPCCCGHTVSYSETQKEELHDDDGQIGVELAWECVGVQNKKTDSVRVC